MFVKSVINVNQNCTSMGVIASAFFYAWDFLVAPTLGATRGCELSPPEMIDRPHFFNSLAKRLIEIKLLLLGLSCAWQ